MRWQAIGSRTLFWLAVTVGRWQWPSAAPAQTNNNSNNNNQPRSSPGSRSTPGVVQQKMVVDPARADDARAHRRPAGNRSIATCSRRASCGRSR